MTHYVYMIECINGSYYTGYTTDIKRRYQKHLKGSAKCRYTRSFPPKKLAAYWLFDNKSDALAVENQIKQLSKIKKQNLLREFESSSHRINQKLITSFDKGGELLIGIK